MQPYSYMTQYYTTGIGLIRSAKRQGMLFLSLSVYFKSMTMCKWQVQRATRSSCT